MEFLYQRINGKYVFANKVYINLRQLGLILCEDMRSNWLKYFRYIMITLMLFHSVKSRNTSMVDKL